MIEESLDFISFENFLKFQFQFLYKTFLLSDPFFQASNKVPLMYYLKKQYVKATDPPTKKNLIFFSLMSFVFLPIKQNYNKVCCPLS